MARKNVVTGAASGIGLATATLLAQRGEEVIGVDVHAAPTVDVIADLATAEGRQAMVDAVSERSGGSIDAVMAVAGISAPVPATVSINYFGAIATLEGLRPLLNGSGAPRALAVASMASLQPNSAELVDAMLANDETKALALARDITAQGPEIGYLVYSSSKAALARWIRKHAPSDEWAGAGIALNSVAPGIVLTPMTKPLLATEEGRAATLAQVPSPLGGPSEAVDIAEAIAFLVSPAAKHICGQVLFADSGYDAVTRGDQTW